MTKIVPLLRTIPSATPHERFCAARQEMARRFREWLETDPPAPDVHIEIAGTGEMLRGLRDLMEGDGA